MFDPVHVQLRMQDEEVLNAQFRGYSVFHCHWRLSAQRRRFGGGPRGGGPRDGRGPSLGRLLGGPMSRDEGMGRRMAPSLRSSVLGGPLGGPLGPMFKKHLQTYGMVLSNMTTEMLEHAAAADDE